MFISSSILGKCPVIISLNELLNSHKAYIDSLRSTISSLGFLHFFFILFFWTLGNFKWLVFELADSLFCLIRVCYWSSMWNYLVQSLCSLAPLITLGFFFWSLCLCWTSQLTLLSYTVFLILLGCLSVFSYNSLSFFHWLFWILCQAVCRSPLLLSQLLLFSC